MKIILTFIFIFSLAFQNLSAQDLKEKSAVPTYIARLNNTNIYSRQPFSLLGVPSYRNEDRTFNFFNFSLELITANKRKNFFSLSLTFPIIQIRERRDIAYVYGTPVRNDFTSTFFNAGLSFAYVQNFNKKKFKKLLPSLALSVDPMFNYQDVKYENSYNFGYSSWGLTSHVNLSPGLSLFIGKHLNMMIAVPISIVRFDLTRTRQNNPILSLRDQNPSPRFDQQLLFGDVFNLKMGIGFNF